VVTAQRHSTADVLPVPGEVDLTTSPQLREEIRQCLNSKPPVLVLDMTRALFLGAAGLAVLVEVTSWPIEIPRFVRWRTVKSCYARCR
jgi:anti-anti-sigma factor